MNKNKQFELTEFWSKKLRDKLRSFYRTVYLGPPTFVLLNVIFCFALKRGTDFNFWTLFIPITIGSTVYCVLLPQRAIRRYKNLIQTLEFESDDEIILTLIDGRRFTVSNPEFKEDVFNVGNSAKACKSVINKSNGSSYTIIPEFFTHPPIL